MAKVILERNSCIGCGACQAVCPKFWEIGSDNKTCLIGSEKVGDEKYQLIINDPGCSQQASEACPVQCITIEK